MGRNLLKNPSGDVQLLYWDLIENGGSGWKVEDLPGDCDHDFGGDGVARYFATSFQLCVKRQVIDLEAEGLTREQLDYEPNIVVKDWYCGRTDCGCTYGLNVCLLNRNQQTLQAFRPDLVTLDPESDGGSWKQVTHTFSGYGPGVRYVCFEHGGQDTKAWEGWFGVRVTGSSVTVEV